MTNKTRWATQNRMLVLYFVVALGVGGIHRPGDAAETPGETSELSRKGADTCLACHDEDSDFPVMSIFKTRHAQPADSRSPFAQLQCETCHGAGEAHSRRVRRGEERPELIEFGSHEETPVAQQNTICLDCHQGGLQGSWHGSMHAQEEISCADCHTVHARRDPVSITSQQPEVCFGCHQERRADSFKASVHPIRYGQMACTACHTLHGQESEHLLTKQTVNQTCYTCHAEYRGPYLWEHAPVTEDCSSCHIAHGSNHPALLTRRPPLLCQQCHSQAGHPSVAYTADGVPPAGASGFLLARGCMNCHSQVHGSNHPSGANLTR